ncbi:MAG: hypothetical protein C4312_03860 [Thermoflexus sp.]
MRQRVRWGIFLVLAVGAALSVRPAWAASNDNNVEWYGLGHNSRDSFYRNPTMAVPTGQRIHLRLRVYRYDITGAVVRVWDSAAGQEALYPMAWETNDATYDYWGVDIPARSYPTVLWYHFRIYDGTAVAYYADDGARDGGWGMPYASERDAQANDYNITIYDPNFVTPDWLKNAVIYQIFPDRFYNGNPTNDPTTSEKVYGDSVLFHTNWFDLPENPPRGRDFYGGDLEGVLAKIDVLQDLGVTAIYLNPIFRAPSNHKYDTVDHKQVDPHLGSLTVFQNLSSAAHNRGMRLILDGVFNHTSVAHPFFQDVVARGSASPYWSWYTVYRYPIRWFDDINRNHRWDPGEPQVNWDSPLQGILGSPDYASWWGFATLPEWTEIQAVRDYVYGAPDAVARYWLNQGADGWRLDVADEISHGFWQAFRQAVKATRADAPIIGEVWGDASEFLTGREMDSVMNYRLKFALTDFIAKRSIPASAFHNRLLAIQEDYPPQAWYALMNLLDSHDTARFLYDAGGSKARLRLAFLFLMTYPGAPTIYYGDEVGLTGANDPDNRRTYPWGREDMALRADVRRLIRIRSLYAALRTGSIAHGVLLDDSQGLYGYRRWDASNRLLIGLNNSDAARTLTFPTAGYLADGTRVTDLWNGGQYWTRSGQVAVPAPATGGTILVAGTANDVKVTFTVQGFVTAYGQNIFVVGDTPELGFWDPAKARPLQWVNTSTWSGDVYFTDYSKCRGIQYKYIVKNPDGSVIWEGGSNHVRTLPCSGSAVFQDTWQP